EVIGRWSAGILGSVVLSAVSSVVIVRSFLGSEPLFRIPVTTFKRPTELIAYAVLGIVGGLASVAFAKSIAYLRPRLKALPRWTQYFQPALAGLLVGLIAFLGAPQVMGVLFAGFLRVPMTSVFMVLEVSGNYEIIVPVIVANTFSYLVSRGLQPIPIFDLLTRQDGLILPSLEEDREETILRVEDAMLPVPPTILNAQDYVDANAHRIQDSTDPFFLVRLHPSGWNVISSDQLQRI